MDLFGLGWFYKMPNVLQSILVINHCCYMTSVWWKKQKCRCWCLVCHNMWRSEIGKWKPWTIQSNEQLQSQTLCPVASCGKCMQCSWLVSISQYVNPEHSPYCLFEVFVLVVFFKQLSPSSCKDSFAEVLFFRFIGSAKISLRDLASGQVKSLPSKNVPLINEKQQAVGVNTFS